MVTPGQLNRRAALFEQLAAMISAGVPLTQALEMAGKNRGNGIPRHILQEITAHLQEGHTFTDAMQLTSGQKRGSIGLGKKAHHAYWLTDFDLALLTAGEESGRLDTTFRLLARYDASRAKIIRDTIVGMLTTLGTLHVFLIVWPLDYLTGFALGLLHSSYSECIPFVINKVIIFGSLYGAAYLLIFACQGSRGEAWRAQVQAIFTAIPVLGKALKSLTLARLACALGALTNAGVPVIRSWEIAGSACGSMQLKRELLRILPQIETGTTPAEMIGQIRYFPELFANLYHTAEISGQLDETLARLHTYYEEEGFRTLQLFSRLLTGAIYGLVVLMAVRFIFHFYIGYFNGIKDVL